MWQRPPLSIQARDRDETEGEPRDSERENHSTDRALPQRIAEPEPAQDGEPGPGFQDVEKDDLSESPSEDPKVEEPAREKGSYKEGRRYWRQGFAPWRKEGNDSAEPPEGPHC